MLAYFLPSVILSSYTNAKKAILPCSSITKCHVTRYGGGLQSRAKNKAPFEKTPSCGFFHNGAMVLLGVSFYLCLGWSANSPRRFARVDGICDASLASRDCTLSTGEHKRVRNRMNSSKRFTVRYIGRLPLLA